MIDSCCNTSVGGFELPLLAYSDGCVSSNAASTAPQQAELRILHSDADLVFQLLQTHLGLASQCCSSRLVWARIRACWSAATVLGA